MYTCFPNAGTKIQKKSHICKFFSKKCIVLLHFRIFFVPLRRYSHNQNYFVPNLIFFGYIWKKNPICFYLWFPIKNFLDNIGLKE